MVSLAMARASARMKDAMRVPTVRAGQRAPVDGLEQGSMPVLNLLGPQLFAKARHQVRDHLALGNST